VCDQDTGAWLQVEDPLCRGDISCSEVNGS